MRKFLIGVLLLAAPMLAASSAPASACDWGWGYGYTAPVYGYYAGPRYSYGPRYRRYAYWPSGRVYGYYASPGFSFYVGSRPYRDRDDRWWW